MSTATSRREFIKRSSAAAAAAGLGLPASTLLAQGLSLAAPAQGPERHFLYVVSPGIRNYVEWGGVGVLVYDMQDNHRLVKRIPTLASVAGEAAENVKGVCASAATGRMYVTTPRRMYCIDLVTERVVWNRLYEGGCDRMSVTPDGSTVYLPSFEGAHWHVVDGATGETIKRLEIGSGAHNTIVGVDGRYAYLAGLRSPLLPVVDTRTREVIGSIGPFTRPIRPFTVNGSDTLCFVNVNELLGFEVGDIQSRKMLHRVEVEGFRNGPVKRHGCPSHGIGLTPDEREIWLADGPNSHLHVFDATVMPPRQIASIPVRDQPGWITFSLDGRFAYPSTGEVINTQSKQIITRLQDERAFAVQSEKVIEVVTVDGRPTRVGDQFGLGRRVPPRAG